MDQDSTPSVVPRRAGRVFASHGQRATIAFLAIVAAAAIAVAAIPSLRNTEPHEAALRGLQIRVLAITQAAAENRIDSALDALAALERDLDEAAGSGLISAARFKGIDAALEAVRADLVREADAGAAAAKAAVTAASPTPAPAPTPASPVPAPPPAPIPVPEQPGMVQEPAPGPAAKPGPPANVQEPKGKAKGAGKP